MGAGAELREVVRPQATNGTALTAATLYAYVPKGYLDRQPAG
jgi:hypothetical protein